MPFQMDIRDPCIVTPHIVAVLVLFVVSRTYLIIEVVTPGSDDLTVKTMVRKCELCYSLQGEKINYG